MKTLLRFFFRLLYHEFAFTYDLVAATVSFNRWKDWVLSALPFIQGKCILEIGHGPGHLQQALRSRGQNAIGIDESAQMGRLAKRNLQRAAVQINLVRGVAQQLPFRSERFDTVVSTFPSEYIFSPETLTEARRVLTPEGRFIVLPSAVLTGRGAVDRFLAWVFRITGETPPNLSEIIHERSRAPFAKAGFHLEVHEINVRSSLVFVMLATKIRSREDI